MKLYHGTSSRFLNKILKQGIKPRGKRSGNWKHTIMSNERAVYMTVAYSLHYALCSLNERDDVLILEIDSNKLNPFVLAPDEDFMEQATRTHPDFRKTREVFSAKDQMHEMTAYFRNRLLEYNYLWEASIKHLGNCCYFGTIPTDSITRYALIKRNDPIIFASDPTITLMNFSIMGDYYKSLSAMLFGDEPLINQQNFNYARLPTKEFFNQIEVFKL